MSRLVDWMDRFCVFLLGEPGDLVAAETRPKRNLCCGLVSGHLVSCAASDDYWRTQKALRDLGERS